MRKVAVFTSLLSLLAIASSCSQASADNKKVNSNTNTGAIATPVPGNMIVDDGTNRKTVVVETANTNFPAATANRRSEAGTRGERPDTRPDATPMPLQFKPAAEDSEIAIAMERDGTVREVRVFRSHPKLAKVEMTYKPAEDKTIRVTLRDGKTVEVKSNRIKALQSAKASELLALTGKK